MLNDSDNTISWNFPDPSNIDLLPLTKLPLLKQADTLLSSANQSRWPDASVIANIISDNDHFCFTHYLSEHYLERNIRRFPSGRTTTEKLSIGYFHALCGGSNLQNKRLDVAQTLLDLASLVHKFNIGFRTSDVYTNRDLRGVRIQYPGWRKIRGGIASIQDLVSNWNGSPILLSVIVVVSIVSLHPFVDGNGRISRIFFNLLCGFDTQSYAPLAEINFHSHGGYEIRVRQAVLFGEWTPIIEHHCAVICLAAQLNRLCLGSQ